MKTTKYTLKFITPCFCAGADPATAEIRPSSIRGQLRWWFRALGGTREDESHVFGSINSNAGQASSLIIRTEVKKQGKEYTPPEKLDINDSLTYVLHFIKASGNGNRWQTKGSIPNGTLFDLIIIQKSIFAASLQIKLDLAIECFCRIGCLGLRATRGLGAMSLCNIDDIEINENEAALGELKEKIKPYFQDFNLRDTQYSTWEASLKNVGSLLKSIRKDQNNPGTKASPLGGGSKHRQTSSIYFRPVMINGKYQILIFRAPLYVLGEGIKPSQIDLSHL